MLYTLTPPRQRDGRIRLYPTRQAALAHAPEGRVVHAVAVNFDDSRCCLVPADRPPWGLDPGWTAPVELDDDGVMTTHGPLPEVLFRT